MKKRLFSLGLSAVLAVSLCPSARASEAAAVVRSISAGSCHALAVDEQGGLWAWGWNQKGELGDPALDNSGGDVEGPFQSYPVRVMEDVASASAGSWTSAAVRTDGSLWCWGNGQAPKKLLDGARTVALDRYLDGGAAVTVNGELWLWGNNSLGQLAPAGVEGNYFDAPVQVMEGVADAVIGYGHVMALKTDGTLWSWGHDSFGTVGAGEVGGDLAQEPYLDFRYRAEPVQVLDLVTKISAGDNGAMALREDGSLWAWGLNSFGAANAADEYGQAYQNIPVQVMEGVSDMASGHGAAYIIKMDGTLWALGGNTFGELGNGTAGEPPEELVPVLADVAQVEAGDCYAIALKSDGSLWSWGINGEGQLGNGGKGNGASSIGPTQSVPAQVHFAPPAAPEGSLTAYPGVSFAISVDGSPRNLSMYGLKDEAGNRNYYVRLRDVAAILTETPAEFDMAYDAGRNEISLTTGERYQPQTGDRDMPFAGVQTALPGGSKVTVDGAAVELNCFTLTDSTGGGHTYFKLRDLGKVLGFNVCWDSEYHHEFLDVSGRILIETDKPYMEE